MGSRVTNFKIELILLGLIDEKKKIFKRILCSSFLAVFDYLIYFGDAVGLTAPSISKKVFLILVVHFAC